MIFLFSGEPFYVLLRTSVTNRRSNNGLHGGTSISWTSPPFSKYILNSLPLPCQVKEILGVKKYGFNRMNIVGGLERNSHSKNLKLSNPSLFSSASQRNQTPWKILYWTSPFQCRVLILLFSTPSPGSYASQSSGRGLSHRKGHDPRS